MSLTNEFVMMEKSHGAKIGNAGVWEAIFNALADLPDGADDQVRAPE